MGMPFVAVVGGLWNLDEDVRPKAEEAGRILGAELAKAGFGLVTYFSDGGSLEPWVVSGYVQALGDRKGRIKVRYADGQNVGFPEEAGREGLFEHDLFPTTDWEAPFYRSLAEKDGIDGIILLGGKQSTLIAGQIAMARLLPILAVDKFGGSASKIRGQLAQMHSTQKYPAWGTKPPSEFVARLKADCLAAARRSEEARRSERALAKLKSRMHKVRWACAGLVLLLLTIGLGLSDLNLPQAFPAIVLAGLMAAGATGAMVRVLLDSSAEDARSSFLLGAISGLVVGIAYLIPQLISSLGGEGPASSMLHAKATGPSPIDRIEFASAVLVAVSAGVGFDTVFRRLQKQAEDVRIGPPEAAG